jgi:hypothetical protein
MDPRWLSSLELAWADALPLLDPAAITATDPDPDQHLARMWEIALQGRHPDTRQRDNQDPARPMPLPEDGPDPGLSGPDAPRAESAGL